MDEEYWAVPVDTRPGSEEPSFAFVLPLRNLPREQTATVRQQAEQVVGKYASSERAILLETFRQIVRLTTERLETPPVRRPATVYVVRVYADPTDPMAQLMDDRGTVIAWAKRFADNPDPMIASVWEAVAGGFDSLSFVRRLED